MKFIRRKIAVVLLTLLILTAALVFYINNIFLPFQFKAFITTQAYKYLHREVSIREIHFELFKGFTLRHITIYQRDEKNKPFIHIDETSFNILLTSFLKNKTLIIPTLKITRPFFHFIREEEKSNFSDLLESAKPRLKNEPLTFISRKVIIEDGIIVYTDKTPEKDFWELFKDINFNATLSLNKSAHFVLTTQIPRHLARVNIKGTYHLPTKRLASQISLSQIPLAEYLALWPTTRPWDLENGLLSSADVNILAENRKWQLRGTANLQDTRLRIGEDKKFTGDVRLDQAFFTGQNQQWQGKGYLHLASAEMTIGPDTTLKGDISMKIVSLATLAHDVWVEGRLAAEGTHLSIGSDKNFRGDIEASDILFAREGRNIALQGNLLIKKSDFKIGSFYPQLGDITVTGTKLTFKDEVLNLRGNLGLQGMAIETSFALANFPNPTLDLDASSTNLNLERLSSIFPELSQRFHVQLNGEASATASYQGPAAVPAQADVQLMALVRKAAISGGKLPQDITDISGEIHYANNLVVWKNLKGAFAGEQYRLDGQLKDFSRPVVNLDVFSQKLNLSGQIKILHDAFQIPSLTAKYLNSSVDLKGDVHLSATEAPEVDLRGNFSLDLNDLPGLAAKWKEKVEILYPQGMLSGEGLFKGRLNDWRNWQLTFRARSPSLSLKDSPFNDVTIQFDQRDRHISRCSFISKLYEGSLTMEASADLAEEQIPVKISGGIEKLNLAKFRKERHIGNEYLAGELSTAFEVNGPIADLDQLRGKGSLRIMDGYLWQWRIIEGIWGALFIPEFKDVVFTEAQADFLVQNRKILSENIHLEGNTVDLKGKGWIDFSRNIHFDIVPVFSNLTLLQSNSLKKGPTSILAKAEGYLNIKLTGTLNNPKYHVETFPIKVIEKTKDILKEGIKDILEEIF